MKDGNRVDVGDAEVLRTGRELRFGRQIGSGGMGVVREAYDPTLRRVTAVKLLKPTRPEQPIQRLRFLKEAQITAQLDHPHIVPVYELGEHPEHGLFFTMKQVSGETLSDVILGIPLQYRTSRHLFAMLQIFLKLCDAVSFAHSRGVLHGDLKPDNVMVASHGRVYLMDWGAALVVGDEDEFAARARSAVGTPNYMAPEQLAGDPGAVDARADVFSLGGILYQILTQQPPYPVQPREAVLLKAVEGAVRPPQEVVTALLPPRLCAIAMKALARNPEDRYQSARGLKQDVELFLQSGWQFPIEAYEPGSVIVREGAVGNTAYVIISGRCRAYRGSADEPKELRELGPGEVFGETAVFSQQPRSATVEAQDQVTAMAISREHFIEDLGLGFWMGLFVRALAERFLEKEQQVLELERRLNDTG